MRLFRFFSAQGALSTLESGTLRVGRLGALNDPFEWRMATEGIDGLENVEPALAAAMLRNQEEEFVRMIGANTGVLCFSGNARESVLWSHYADHHRGIALEIAVTDDAGKRLIITYTDERLFMDYKRWIGEGESYGIPLILKMIRRKSTGWSYEDEHRLYEDLDGCKISNGHYFRNLPRPSLHRVILGWRCDVEESYIKRLLRKSEFENCNVVRARPENRTFHIRYDGDDDPAADDIVKLGDDD